jgi:hypothetical protein
LAKKTENSPSSEMLNATAETIGSALGQVAARLDAWKKDRAAIAADIQKLAKSAQAMLAELGHAAETGFNQSRKGGRPKGTRVSDETKAKLREAWARRKAQAGPAVQEHTKPADERANIRSKAPRTWTNRQAGKG